MDGIVKVQETNRTGFVYPMPYFNISISINNTQETDSGEYMCTVNIVDEDTISGKNIGLINLTVLGKSALVKDQCPVSPEQRGTCVPTRHVRKAVGTFSEPGFFPRDRLPPLPSSAGWVWQVAG